MNKLKSVEVLWSGRLVGHLALTKDGLCADLLAVATTFGL